MRLYYHKTDGGAKYLTDTFIKWEHNGKRGEEGTTTDKTKIIVRIDGNIEKDAEYSIINHGVCSKCGYNTLGLTNKELKQ